MHKAYVDKLTMLGL